MLRSVFKLIRLEVAFLWKTIVLIGLILITFISALLSVISVLLDVPEGMYAGLDEYLHHFTLKVSDARPDLDIEGESVYGFINGITRYSILKGPGGEQVISPPTAGGEEDELLEITYTFTGCAIRPSLLKEFEPYKKLVGKGRLPNAPGEICINATVAKLVGASIGDTVTLRPDPQYAEEYDFTGREETSFTLVGTHDNSVISRYNAIHPRDYIVPSYYFYLMMPEETTYSTLTFLMPNSRTMHQTALSLIRGGREATMDGTSERQMENVALAQAFFGAIAAVIGFMVLFILYSLIAIFFRQRRAQILRMRLLGATSFLVAAVYCTVAIFLVFLGVVLGSAFSMAFNVYFMGLCGSLFKTFSSNFISHFRPIIPFILLLVLAAFTLILFFVVNRKVRNARLSVEVRHE